MRACHYDMLLTLGSVADSGRIRANARDKQRITSFANHPFDSKAVSFEVNALADLARGPYVKP